MALRPSMIDAWFKPGVFPLLLGNALIGSVAPLILMFYALQYTTPTEGALVEQVEIIYSAFIAVVFLGERIPARQIVASIGIAAGAAIVLYDPNLSINRGNLIMLFIPICFQTSHVFAKKLLRTIDPIAMAGGRHVFAALTVGWLALAFGSDQFDGVWNFKTLGALVILGVVMHAANALLWFVALSRMGLAKCTAIVMAYPVFTALFEWAYTGTTLAPRTLAALAVVAAALALLVTSRTASPPPPELT